MTEFDRVKQIHHLSQVLYDTTRDIELISKTKADIIQDIINEMQELLDTSVNERIRREQED